MAEKIVSSKKEIGRIKLYVEGLDEQIEGGVPEGHVVLVCGVAGTMKSSFTFNVVYNEVLLKNKTALYITLEQSSSSLLNHMTNVGFDLTKIPLQVVSDIGEIDAKFSKIAGKKGALVMADLGAIRKEMKGTKIGPSGDWLNALKNIVKRLKEKAGCDLFVLDSLSALYVLSKFENPRTELFYTFEFLRDLGLTTFIISEMPLNRSKYGEYEVEDFLSDGIIRLDLVERQRKVTREIAIVKMRTTACNTDIFSLEVERGKFKALYGGQPALI